MTPTMRVREWTAAERHALRRGLKAADGFAVRRCQMRLASAGRVGPAAIGAAVGRSARAVRNAIRAFHADGLGCLTRKPPVAKAPAPVWDRKHDDGLKGLLHRRPREFGQPTRLWALALAAEVCHPNGWTPRRLSPEGRRGVLARLGIGWKRAEHGITSPDPDDAKEKSSATGGSPRPPDARTGWSGSRTSAGGRGSPSPTCSRGRPVTPSGGPNARDPKGAGEREAAACDGVLRSDTGGMMLRFCEGRPVSATTEEFLGWVCGQLAGEGKRVLVLVWDNAAWHVSTRVREWVGRHNRQVSRAGAGCRIRVGPRPIKTPWRNPIEPTWVHGKRAIVEPDWTLAADEVRQRACDYYGCKPQPLLATPAT